MAEINDQFAKIEIAMYEHSQMDEDDGTLKLDSASHPSIIPNSKSEIIPLSIPTNTLTANKSNFATTHMTKLCINNSITILALVSPQLSNGLMSVHHISKRV